MTIKDIVKINKEAIEDVLKCYELECSELLDIAGNFSIISTDFVIQLDEVLPETGFNFEYEYIDIKDTIKLVQEFLSSIDKKYLDIFNKSLVDGTFELFLKEDDLIERPDYPITSFKPQPIIYIPVLNNMSDGLIIVHEFFHYLNDKEQLVGVRKIFTEMISIYFELRFGQFLSNKGISTSAFYKEVCERLENVAISCDNLYFTSAVLDIYHNTGEIKRKNIKFLDKYRQVYDYSQNDILGFYQDIDFIDGINEFSSDVSYVLGTLLSFKALKDPIVSDVKMKYINDNINEMTIKDVLLTLETDFDEYLEWIEECINNLKKAKGEVYEKSYSYSRTNCSRKD